MKPWNNNPFPFQKLVLLQVYKLVVLLLLQQILLVGDIMLLSLLLRMFNLPNLFYRDLMFYVWLRILLIRKSMNFWRDLSLDLIFVLILILINKTMQRIYLPTFGIVIKILLIKGYFGNILNTLGNGVDLNWRMLIGIWCRDYLL